MVSTKLNSAPVTTEVSSFVCGIGYAALYNKSTDAVAKRVEIATTTKLIIVSLIAILFHSPGSKRNCFFTIAMLINSNIKFLAAIPKLLTKGLKLFKPPLNNGDASPNRKPRRRKETIIVSVLRPIVAVERGINLWSRLFKVF